MFARTTREQGRSNGGRLLRVENVQGECRFWIDFCAHHRNQYFLGAASIISRPVICQFSSAGKHFLHLKTFVWNMRFNMNIFFLPFAG